MNELVTRLVQNEKDHGDLKTSVNFFKHENKILEKGDGQTYLSC